MFRLSYETNSPLPFFCLQNNIIKLLYFVLLHVGKIKKKIFFSLPELDAKLWLFSFIQCVATEVIWKFIR